MKRSLCLDAPAITQLIRIPNNSGNGGGVGGGGDDDHDDDDDTNRCVLPWK